MTHFRRRPAMTIICNYWLNEHNIKWNIRNDLQLRGDHLAIKFWLGRQDSNLRMTASKAVALPLGDAPSASQEAAL